ncbi:RNA-binding protein 45-like [Montipora foliosa]|uniref:RNA-binding protein 45-like n=1 Tax=Montipora foliosa TaxID=591990 RepID=UPI0035F17EB3
MATNHQQAMDAGSVSGRVDVDNPPFSRIFIVCSKKHTSDDMKLAFEHIGFIEDVWVVKDKLTKENRGVCYIKFSKASSAARACEEMDGKVIGEDPKPIKVMIAQSKFSGSKTDFQDETALTRLFVICPKDYSEDRLRQKFQDFGEIEYVQIVRDHATHENKGYGYVKFRKSSSAAVALENCDKALKAVWAEPKSAKIARNAAAAAAALHSTLIPHNPFLETNSFSSSALAPPVNVSMNSQSSIPGVVDYYGGQNPAAAVAESITTSHTPTRLFVKVSPLITAEQLSRLFDIIPGMQICDLKRNFNTGESKGFAYVTYNSVGSAIYAKEKLNGFEYPPGSKLVVKYAEDPPGARNNGLGQGNDAAFQVQSYGSKSSLTGNPYAADPGAVYTTAALPAPAPLADMNSEVASRLFIVCQPAPPPENALKDVFSRFGNLIDVWMMKERNFGYAKFASKESADAAIEGLHGHEVLGMKLKVMHADPPKSEASRKRPRT